MTPDKLRELIFYDPETGVITARVARPPIKVGQELGWIAGGGKSIDIMIGGKAYKAHRLAWCYFYGEWPSKRFHIDHINRNPTDNRICNLRLATNAQNARNTSLSRRNSSGVKGVMWYKRHQKWTAQIRVDRKLKHLGYFDRKADAIKARRDAEKKFFSDFAPGTN